LALLVDLASPGYIAPAGATLPAGQPTLLAPLLLWKKSGTQWTDAELSPVRQLMPTATGATVVLADGTHRVVKFGE
jgi:hypothetical protein